MSLLRTLLLDYQLIETGVNTRSSLQNDNVSYLSQTGMVMNQGVLISNAQSVYNNIAGVIFVRCSAPLQAALNNGNVFTINSLFINFGSMASLTLTNIDPVNSVNYIVVSA